MDRLNFLKLGHLLKIMLLLLLLLFSSFFLFLLCVFTFYTRQPGREGGREEVLYPKAPFFSVT